MIRTVEDCAVRMNARLNSCVQDEGINICQVCGHSVRVVGMSWRDLETADHGKHKSTKSDRLPRNPDLS